MKKATERGGTSISQLSLIIIYDNFDLHHMCFAVNNCQPTTTIRVISATEENYISINCGLLIDTYLNKNGKKLKMCDYLIFMTPSKRWTARSKNQVGIMNAMFPTVLCENIQLLKQTRFCPYSYMSNRAMFFMFFNTCLPSLNQWGNTLEDGKVIKKNINHANRMWEVLGCVTLQCYHDGHLKLECVLLASICEFRWELIFTSYKLVFMHFLTLPNMAEPVSLRICKANAELLMVRKDLDMIEPAISVVVNSLQKTTLRCQQPMQFQTKIAGMMSHLVSVLMQTIYMLELCNSKNSPFQSLYSKQKSSFTRS